jgi:membrane-associated phospholipid phosphatase
VVQNQQRPSRETKTLTIQLIVGLAITLACILLFTELGEDVSQRETFVVDLLLIHWVEAFRSPGVTEWMNHVTDLGSVTWLTTATIITTVTLWRRGKLRDGVMVAAGMAATSILNIALKGFYERQRPEDALIHEIGYSFPSGHAMGAMTFYSFLLYLTVKSTWQPWIKSCTGLLLLGIIVAVGWSRVYLGVHYPTDVIAGFVAGAFIVITSLCIRETYRRYRQRSSWSSS